MSPLLTVICLCYNQEQFLEEAIHSVFSQEGVVFEVIIVDDCSSDGSQGLIKKNVEKFTFAHTILHDRNVGNCKSFNQALKLAKGKYIIDLACDDYFSKGTFEKQIDFFEKQKRNVGMIFSNAFIVDDKGAYIKHHFTVDKKDRAIVSVPSGKVFADVLERYFICVPSMVMRKSWLIGLGGYNEQLSYEDFDIWVRGSLISEFVYFDEVLVSKRVHSNQLSKRMLSSKGANYYDSTLNICQFASNQVKSTEEVGALIRRLKYEGRNASYFQFFRVRNGFRELLREHQAWSIQIAIKWQFFAFIGNVLNRFT